MSESPRGDETGEGVSRRALCLEWGQRCGPIFDARGGFFCSRAALRVTWPVPRTCCRRKRDAHMLLRAGDGELQPDPPRQFFLIRNGS